MNAEPSPFVLGIAVGADAYQLCGMFDAFRAAYDVLFKYINQPRISGNPAQEAIDSECNRMSETVGALAKELLRCRTREPHNVDMIDQAIVVWLMQTEALDGADVAKLINGASL